jgi:hypothetical protein
VPHVLSKKDFAASVGVSPSRLSHWLRDGKIDGAAIVGSGYSAKIDAEIAKAQLDSRLDLNQGLGANGRAQVAGGATVSPAPGSTLDTGIKSARLRQLQLANERAAAEVAAGSGRYIEAEAARLEMGRIAGRMVTAFDGVLPDLADAIAAGSTLSARDALHLLRGAWLASRARLSGGRVPAAVMEPSTSGVAQ